MIVFPNAKINLGLRVLDRRDDGYHNISTVIYPLLELYDVLEMIPSDRMIFKCEGPYSVGLSDNNLCVKAYELLKMDYNLPPVHIYLYKNIPVGSGLGGGSSDAVSTLKLTNVIFSLGLNDEQLANYALKLGSDCPYFIKNKACYITGKGEIIEPIHLDLSDYKIEIKMPGVTINTAWAYNQIAEKRSNESSGLPANDVMTALQSGINNWKFTLINDFENVVFGRYPQIKDLKNEFYSNGAVYASLSGSGASVYGVSTKN